MELTTYETNPAAAIELLQQEYSWLPSKELERRALQVFRTNAPKIRAALGGGSMFATFYNINKAALNALLEDYARALLGVYIPVATPSQIETLKPLLTDDAYNIDRWGLGLGVIHNYWNISAGLQLYEKAHQSKERATAYLNEVYRRPDTPEPTCIFLTTIYQTEHAGRYFFDYDYFNEAAGEKAVKVFMGQCRVNADLYAYTLYSGIVEYVLGGKEEPRVPERIKALKNLPERAKENTREADKILKGGSEDDTIEEPHRKTSTPENPMKVRLRAQIREQEEDSALILRKTNILNNILSRPPETLENPTEYLTEGRKDYGNIAVVHAPGELIPIAQMIEDRLRLPGSELHHLESRPSEIIVAKALGGLDAALQRLQPAEASGLYTIDTTLNEFAADCGMEAEPWERKLQLIDALHATSQVWLAMTDTRKTKKGKTIRRTLAIQALNLRAVEREAVGEEGHERRSYRLIVDIAADVLKNGSQSILAADYDLFCKEFKGASGFRFIHQLLNKFNKSEDDMIDEVFGNAVKIKEAERGLRKTEAGKTPAEEAKLVKRTIQQNRPHQRKQLAAMFEKAKELGLIKSYTRKKSAKGRGYVYSWYRKTPADRLGLSEG